MDQATSALQRLLAVMAALRDPDTGCAWDRRQTFATLAPYAVEEAYELADALRRGDMDDVKGELGDLLLQVVFHARMAEELGAFDFAAVAHAIADKMERRHPHVFARDGGERAPDPAAWEAIKAAERAAKGMGREAFFADIPIALPGLSRAVKLSARAARVGFEWAHVADIVAKLHEEVAELQAEVEARDQDRAREELGDLLFVCANLARKLAIDPEDAIRAANAKFVRRFTGVMEALGAAGRNPEQSTLEEMDELWDAVKAGEKAAAADG